MLVAYVEHLTDRYAEITAKIEQDNSKKLHSMNNRQYPETCDTPSACRTADIDPRLLGEMLRLFSGREIHSFVLIKDGIRLVDLAVPPYVNDVVQDIHSASKTFTAVACGFAMQEGRFRLDTPIVDLVGGRNWAPGVDKLPVRHLLTMTAGQAAEDFQLIWEEEDWSQAFLSTPLTAAPGFHFEYNNFCSFMLSAAIQRISGQRLLDYLDPRLFDPLGIAERYWEQLGKGVDWGASGLYLSVESMTRFGRFLLNRGCWNGQQLLSADFVDAMATRQIDSYRKEVPAWIEDNQGYGFQTWMNSFGGFRASGLLQQEIVVLPAYGITAVLSGGVCDLEWEPLSLFRSHLLPACEQGYHGGDEELWDSVRELSRPMPCPGREQSLPELPAKRYQLDRLFTRWRTFHIDLHVEAVGIERTPQETAVTLINRGVPTRFRCPASGDYTVGTMNYSINGEPFDLRPAVCGGWLSPKTFELTFRPLTRKMWMVFTIEIVKPEMIELTVSFDPRHRAEPEAIRGREIA